MNVLRKLFDEENKNWRGIIQQKANEFTNFCKIKSFLCHDYNFID